VGRRQQPAALGDGEGFGKRGGWEGGFIAVQPEAHYALGRQIDSQSGGLLGGLRSGVAIGGDHEPEPDPQSSGRGAAGFEHEPHRIRFGAEQSLEESRPQRHLDPHGPVFGCIFDDLADDTDEVLGDREDSVTRPDGVHEDLERRVRLVRRDLRRFGSVCGTELSEGACTNRPVEMQMQMRLRQRCEITPLTG